MVSKNKQYADYSEPLIYNLSHISASGPTSLRTRDNTGQGFRDQIPRVNFISPTHNNVLNGHNFKNDVVAATGIALLCAPPPRGPNGTVRFLCSVARRRRTPSCDPEKRTAPNEVISALVERRERAELAAGLYRTKFGCRKPCFHALFPHLPIDYKQSYRISVRNGRRL